MAFCITDFKGQPMAEEKAAFSPTKPAGSPIIIHGTCTDTYFCIRDQNRNHTMKHIRTAARVFYVLGRHSALGFSPFSIDNDWEPTGCCEMIWSRCLAR